MSSQWHHLSKDKVVIILSPELIGKSVIGFIHFHKLSMSSFIVRIIFGMVFQGKFSICSLNVIKSSSLSNSKNFIVIVQRIWKMLIEELFLILINDFVFIEELVKGWIGILERVSLSEEFIILRTFVSVRKNFISFSNFLKLGLSALSMFFVFVRMPFGSKLFIGALNFKERGIFCDSEDGIVVFEWLLACHLQDLLNFQL